MTALIESFRKWRSRKAGPSRDEMASIFRAKYELFKQLLASNTELLNIITDLEDKLQGDDGGLDEVIEKEKQNAEAEIGPGPAFLYRQGDQKENR